MNTRPTAAARDRGTALVLVLVLIVIGSLIVVPLMDYSVSVMRANTVLSEKSKRLESVKAGLRVALADPIRLYDACGGAGPSTAVELAPTAASGLDVTTRCYFIDFQTAQSPDELRYGLVATRAGREPPAELRGSSYQAADPTDTHEWWSATTPTSETDHIWLPNLPTHGLNRRASSGTQMPDGFPTCRVFFPGTYPDPIAIDGPAYFASGVYYFEDEVRIEGGADVVVGLGAREGCTNDQEAVFYAESVPGTHNMNGLGGTWVLGDRGRVVVSNANGSALSLRFNTRYVAAGDDGAAPSEGVSIMSVNGELDVDGVTGIDLIAPGVIETPVSNVGWASPVVATSQDYLPSVFTPKPDVPDAPTAAAAQRFVGAARVTWTAPFDGGSAISEYVVTASTGASCVTRGATTCVVGGLTNGVPVTFRVVARNAVGDSDPSVATTAVTPGGSTTLTAPAQPAPPTAVAYARAARITWTASADGGAPISSYTVTASPGGSTCTVLVDTATPPPLSCDITGLDPLVIPGYTFTVVATNAIGTSTPSSPSTPATNVALTLGDPPATVTPPPAAFDPTPILEFELLEPAAATVNIPGYVAVPQGRVLDVNPHGQPVIIAGGVLAAQFDVADARAAGPQTVDIGFLESVVQRKFRIVSTSARGNETSTAVVQVNQNGAYAVNSWEVQ